MSFNEEILAEEDNDELSGKPLVAESVRLADQIVNYSYQFKKKFTKLAVIPTTAGSGAEVTSNAVIYVDGIKHSFESELLIPDNFFLVPEFLISSLELIIFS